MVYLISLHIRDYLKIKNITWKAVGVQSPQYDLQGSGGVAVPGGFQAMGGYGTEGHG